MHLMNTPEYLRFIGDRGITDLQQAKDYIDQYFLESYRQHGFGYYVVRDSDQCCVGMVGLMQRDYLEQPDIGFAFLPDYFGTGLALQSCAILLERARKHHGLKKVLAFTDVENIASQKLLNKLGFKYDGPFCHPDKGDELRLYAASLTKSR